MSHSEHYKASPENLYEPTTAENEGELRDEIDAEVVWQPEGGVMIYARLAGANGGQDVVQIRIGKDGDTQAKIDGKEADEEQIGQLGELLGITLAGKVNPDDIEVSADSPLRDPLERERLAVQREMTLDLREDGVAVSDNELIRRRTEELPAHGMQGTQEVGSTATSKRRDQEKDGILAEQLIRKDPRQVQALADALRAAGDPGKAEKLERDAYEARRRDGGVSAVANSDPILVDFSKQAREAMRLTGKSVDDLEADAKEHDKAA